MTQEIQQLLSSFESIKQTGEWYEYWSARDLQKVLWYTEWRNFHSVIQKAVISCEEAWNIKDEHFVKTNKPLTWGQWAIQEVLDFELSRYACYLILQAE